MSSLLLFLPTLRTSTTLPPTLPIPQISLFCLLTLLPLLTVEHHFVALIYKQMEFKTKTEKWRQHGNKNNQGLEEISTLFSDLNFIEKGENVRFYMCTGRVCAAVNMQYQRFISWKYNKKHHNEKQGLRLLCTDWWWRGCWDLYRVILEMSDVLKSMPSRLKHNLLLNLNWLSSISI